MVYKILVILCVLDILLLIPYTRRLIVVIISIISDFEFFLMFGNDKESWKDNLNYILHG